MTPTRSLLVSGVLAASLAATAAAVAAGPMTSSTPGSTMVAGEPADLALTGAATRGAYPDPAVTSTVSAGGRLYNRTYTKGGVDWPTSTGAPSSCVTRVQQRLTTAQKVGQLLMVGIEPSQAPSGLDGAIAAQHLGGVIYLGGWTGAQTVRSTSAHLQSATGPQGTGGVHLLVAADQEGGQVQQLKGTGFTALPSALTLGTRSTAQITATGALVGRELLAAGVNVDLAPVADTVPAALGRGNGPIGRYDRQFGYDPAVVSRGVTAFTTGLHSSTIVPTVKHFPGLGRITNNTDTSSTGITDTTATTTDTYLQPFVSGMHAGAGMVMISSAFYPRIDAQNQAVFSRPIITDLLRGQLGWKGVVVTDDVGGARSVAAVPVGQRATRFVDAGGDIVLTVSASTAQVMAQALISRYAADPTFAAKVNAAVARVLTLKQGHGLLPCG